MAIKRKFDVEFDDAAPSNAKQLKLIPFPNYLPDDDVAMSDAPPLFDTIPHSRFPSNASSYSSEGGYSPVDSSSSNSPVIGSCKFSHLCARSSSYVSVASVLSCI
jgi:hypothetical protein